MPRALGDRLVLSALKQSQGIAVAVDDDALLRDAVATARASGICMAPEGGACITAVAHLTRQQWIEPDAHVVVFNTGAATKYAEALEQALASEPS